MWDIWKIITKYCILSIKTQVISSTNITYSTSLHSDTDQDKLKQANNLWTVEWPTKQREVIYNSNLQHQENNYVVGFCLMGVVYFSRLGRVPKREPLRYYCCRFQTGQKSFILTNLQGTPKKSNPLGKIWYLWNYRRFFHQIYSVYRRGFRPHILQILLK